MEGCCWSHGVIKRIGNSGSGAMYVVFSRIQTVVGSNDERWAHMVLLDRIGDLTLFPSPYWNKEGEEAVKAASSSGFIFCFCNLIIVIILIDLKPSLSFDQESEIPVSMVRSSTGMTHKCQVQKEEACREVSQEHKEEEMTDKEEEEEEEEEEDDDDDELRRRVEEFIDKVNKAWKAELLSTSSLV
ncbi:nuclear polyadenylated RNA-binding protein 3-like [Senna tora]|uniref:Nuclear polyadenylated RNA-binding protein 3-like n=1 Tax=Senna tora TaxID=362788 RepID=A0A834WH57_9FABA|nr:nuclear polyadenylated RNA-binding protein 3-like [Senna tora]